MKKNSVAEGRDERSAPGETAAGKDRSRSSTRYIVGNPVCRPSWVFELFDQVDDQVASSRHRVARTFTTDTSETRTGAR